MPTQPFFGVVEGVVLSPLPYRAPDRLVVVESVLKDKRVVSPSYPDFLDWQRNARTFQQVAALTVQGFDLTSPGASVIICGEIGSAGARRRSASPWFWTEWIT